MLIIAAILAIFVYGMVAATLGTILPDLSRTFGLTPEENSYIALAQGIGLTIASISVGPLVDNKGKKLSILLALSLIALSLFLLPSSNGFTMIVAMLLLLGLGGGILVTSANALVSDISPTKRASVMNILNLFFGLGGFATPFIAGNILGGNSTKLCYLMAVFTVVTLAANALTRMPPPTKERGFSTAEASVLLSKPALWLLAAFLFLYVACEVGVWNWLPRHLIAQGIPEAHAMNILAGGFALGLLVGRMVVSPILMKVPAATVTLVSAVLMAVTTYVMLQSGDPSVAWGMVFCAGVAMAPVFPTTLAMVGNTFPRMTATAMGIVITSGWIGLVVSSPIIGQIAGTDPAGLRTALLILPAMSVLMIIVNVALRPALARAVAQK
jgi:fucose permease